MSTTLPALPAVSTEDLEAALTTGDVAKLPAATRIRYLIALCHSSGLSPLTRPFILLKTQSGEMQWYATVQAAEALRARHRISVRVVSRERVDDLFCVTVEATLPDGRTEQAVGIVEVTNLKGQQLANAMMKAESKGKRRVTLALVGLGLPLADEDAGHPVRLDWQTGEVLDDPPPRRLPPRQTQTVQAHIGDLYGDPSEPTPVQTHQDAPEVPQEEEHPETHAEPLRLTSDPPEPSSDVLHTGSLVLDTVLAVHRAHGKGDTWCEHHLRRVLREAGVATVREVPASRLVKLLGETRRYYAERAPLPPDTPPWGAALLALAAPLTDLGLYEDVEEQVAQATLAPDEVVALERRIRAALAVQEEA